MFKQITYSSHVDYNGKSKRVIYPVYPSSDSAFRKCADVAELHPELRDFVSRIKPDPEYIYVVVVALGSGESWSSNVNGDWFHREDLQKKHHTFTRNGKVFHLHDNKPDSPSFGEVLFSRFNPNMDRVELVISVSRSGLPEVVDSLEKGETVDVSMGTKVDHDVCSICRKKSKRFSEYCAHLKYEMGRVYPDGRKVYAENPDPDFFDISFVDSGADRTAKALAKVAAESGVRGIVHSALLGEKLSKEKDAEMDKGFSVVEKSLPAKLKEYWAALGEKLESAEKVDLRKLSPNVGLSDALGIATENDTLLKPCEFFSFLLDRMFDDSAHRSLAGHIFDNNLSLWDDSDALQSDGNMTIFTGSLPLNLPNIFSISRRLSPGAVSMRVRLSAGDVAKIASASKISAVRVEQNLSKIACGAYRNYVKLATRRLLKRADMSGLNIAAGLLATLLVGQALLENPANTKNINLGSSDVVGAYLPDALNASNITEAQVRSEVEKQLQQIDRIRRGAEPPTILMQKTAALGQIPAQILSTAAHYLDACGTKTAQIGKLLTEACPISAAVFSKLGKNLSV